MAAAFRVQPATVTVAAGRLDTLAGDGAWTGTAQPLTGVAGAAAGSDLAAQAALLAAEVTTTVTELTVRLVLMGQAASASSGNYQAADRAASTSFARITAALPTAGRGLAGLDGWGAW